MDDAESFGAQRIGAHGTATTIKASSWRSLLETKAAPTEGTAEVVPQTGQGSLQLAAPAKSEPLTEASATEEETEIKYGTEGSAMVGGQLQDTAERSRKGMTKVEDGAEERARLGGGAMSDRRRLTEPHVVEHPCLHKGYSAPYRRMVSHGVLPRPATVQLVGR